MVIVGGYTHNTQEDGAENDGCSLKDGTKKVFAVS